MSRTNCNPAAIAAPVGTYSHGVSVEGPGRWLHVAGQIGLAPDGRLGKGFEEQAQLAWTNLVAVLKEARMEVADLIKLTSYLVEPEHMSLLGAVRAPFLGEARPASTVVIVKALAKPEWLFEVDAVAWHP